MIIETQRLLRREMTPDDDQALVQVLGAPETMWHYACLERQDEFLLYYGDAKEARPGNI